MTAPVLPVVLATLGAVILLAAAYQIGVNRTLRRIGPFAPLAKMINRAHDHLPVGRAVYVEIRRSAADKVDVHVHTDDQVTIADPHKAETEPETEPDPEPATHP